MKKKKPSKFEELMFEIVINKAISVEFYDQSEVIQTAGMSCVPRIGESVVVRSKNKVGRVVGVQWEVPEVDESEEGEFEIYRHVNKARVWLEFK